MQAMIEGYFAIYRRLARSGPCRAALDGAA
jgi:hypothetical protein